MKPYAESNFVLQLTLEQEESEACRALLELAAAGSVTHRPFTNRSS